MTEVPVWWFEGSNLATITPVVASRRGHRSRGKPVSPRKRHPSHRTSTLEPLPATAQTIS